MKFRERFARFMMGRYGVDQLGRALLWLYLGLAIISLFWHPVLFLALAVLIFLFWRTFSKNIARRQAENQWYLRRFGRLRIIARAFRERRAYRYRICPHCRATLRLPNKKGRHTVCCPKCRKDFNVKI